MVVKVALLALKKEAEDVLRKAEELGETEGNYLFTHSIIELQWILLINSL
jgi:hypothetical protein